MDTADKAAKRRLLKVIGIPIAAFLAFVLALRDDGQSGAVTSTPTLAAAQASNTSCPPDAFQLSEVRGRTEHGYLIITANMRNGCQVSAGAQLVTSVYDSRGALIDTDDAWPISMRNLQPGASEDIKIMLKPPSTEKITFKVRPVQTKSWKQ